DLWRASRRESLRRRFLVLDLLPRQDAGLGVEAALVDELAGAGPAGEGAGLGVVFVLAALADVGMSPGEVAALEGDGPIAELDTLGPQADFVLVERAKHLAGDGIGGLVLGGARPCQGANQRRRRKTKRDRSAHV